MVKESIKEAKGVSLILSASPTSSTDLEAQIRSALGPGSHGQIDSAPAGGSKKKSS